MVLALAYFLFPGIAEADETHTNVQLTPTAMMIVGGVVAGLLLIALGVWGLASWSLKRQEETRRRRRDGNYGS
ncbi:MAG: hypothetical protein HYU86_00430 [Chloroflexi bacterium]|nr:hypothetical protein [Chloroflexota bacterium]